MNLNCESLEEMKAPNLELFLQHKDNKNKAKLNSATKTNKMRMFISD